MTDSLIVLTIRKYHPEWEPPDDNGREWISCLCPFHGDSNKSASVSFKNNAFRCFACPVRGDAIALIRSREGVTFAEALRITEELSPESSGQIQSKPARKSSRSVLGDSGFEVGRPRISGGDKQVRSGVRGRPTPWT